MKEFKKEYKSVKVSFLKEHPDNKVRRMTKEQKDALKKSFEEHGYVNPIVCAYDGTILAGHQRFKVLKEMGEKNITVLMCDISDPIEQRKYVIRDNQVRGEYDFSSIFGCIGDLPLVDLGFSQIEVDLFESYKDKQEVVNDTNQSNTEDKNIISMPRFSQEEMQYIYENAKKNGYSNIKDYIIWSCT